MIIFSEPSTYSRKEIILDCPHSQGAKNEVATKNCSYILVTLTGVPHMQYIQMCMENYKQVT